MTKITLIILTTILISCGIFEDKSNSNDASLLLALAGSSSAFGGNNSQIPLNVKLDLKNATALAIRKNSSFSRSSGRGNTLVGLTENGETIQVVQGDNLPEIERIYKGKNIFIQFKSKGNFSVKSSDQSLSRSVVSPLKESETIPCLFTKVDDEGNLYCVDPEVDRFELPEPVQFDSEEKLYYLARNTQGQNILKSEDGINFLPPNQTTNIDGYFVRTPNNIVSRGSSRGNLSIRQITPNRIRELPGTNKRVDTITEQLTFHNDTNRYEINYLVRYNARTRGDGSSSYLPDTDLIVADNRNGDTAISRYFTDSVHISLTPPNIQIPCDTLGIEHPSCIATQFQNSKAFTHAKTNSEGVVIPSTFNNYIIADDLAGWGSSNNRDGRRSLYQIFFDGTQNNIRFVPLQRKIDRVEIVASNNNELLIYGTRIENSTCDFAGQITVCPRVKHSFLSYDIHGGSPIEHLENDNIEIFEIVPLDKNTVILRGLDLNQNSNVIVVLDLTPKGGKRVVYTNDSIENLISL